jgi:hypothetical protein
MPSRAARYAKLATHNSQLATHSSLFLTLPFLLLPSTGCGLVFLPRIQQFPGPVETIRVVDAQSNRDIPDASLRYEIISHGNWMHSVPLCHPEDSHDAADVKRTLQVQRSGDAFTVESCRMVGSVQWFFPVPSPLGWTLYRDHEAVITAEAPDYRPLAIRYAPDFMPEGAQPRFRENCDYMFADGVLWLRLVRLREDSPGETGATFQKENVAAGLRTGRETPTRTR